MTPARISALIETDIKAAEARGVEEGLWTKLVVEDGVVEAALKEMRGFVTVSGVVMNKYGGRELSKNTIVSGVKKASSKSTRGKAGIGFLEIMDDGNDGERVQLVLCQEEGIRGDACKVLLKVKV